MEVLIRDAQEKSTLDLHFVQQVSLDILREMQCDDRCELSIVFVDDAEIHRLNLQYRGLDRPTDVLSFALQEAEFPDIQTSAAHVPFPRLLGDVIISTETTQQHAEERGHSFERELLMLLIHGILHVLGYDHSNDPDAEKMEALERRLYEQFIRAYRMSSFPCPY
ncbi:rRNA maturation RNase YbeY [candidate division KSB3 bacterium]|uniref:Endoribonuclease YbeY n=1 Tax=candidate division KSB3 bacterium TaxID=2044937 RepID=A0A2G6E1Y8_9BACT|nr:MAG: rRNA maturation RNase YbeY [candidate division KSB3 bacterium]PIE28495.1 MAG: rRNA maturation RNase YbeY [candidate division KSB3 bacterium]